MRKQSKQAELDATILKMKNLLKEKNIKEIISLGHKIEKLRWILKYEQ